MSKHAAVESDDVLAERTGKAAELVERLTRWRDDFPLPAFASPISRRSLPIRRVSGPSSTASRRARPMPTWLRA